MPEFGDKVRLTVTSVQIIRKGVSVTFVFGKVDGIKRDVLVHLDQFPLEVWSDRMAILDLIKVGSIIEGTLDKTRKGLRLIAVTKVICEGVELNFSADIGSNK